MGDQVLAEMVLPLPVQAETGGELVITKMTMSWAVALKYLPDVDQTVVYIC